MSCVDVYEEIVVNVEYILENMLKYNDLKDLSFVVRINFDKEVVFFGG